MAILIEHTYLIGYNGLIPQYHTLIVPPADPIEIKPLNLQVSDSVKHYMKLHTLLKDKMKKMIGIPQKRSNNYEGVDKNFKKK